MPVQLRRQPARHGRGDQREPDHDRQDEPEDGGAGDGDPCGRQRAVPTARLGSEGGEDQERIAHDPGDEEPADGLRGADDHRLRDPGPRKGQDVQEGHGPAVAIRGCQQQQRPGRRHAALEEQQDARAQVGEEHHRPKGRGERGHDWAGEGRIRQHGERGQDVGDTDAPEDTPQARRRGRHRQGAGEFTRIGHHRRPHGAQAPGKCGRLGHARAPPACVGAARP
jgi:hypothetical protein